MERTIAEKKHKFKLITEDICVDNPNEVRLAQNLYIEIMYNN